MAEPNMQQPVQTTPAPQAAPSLQQTQQPANTQGEAKSLGNGNLKKYITWGLIGGLILVAILVVVGFFLTRRPQAPVVNETTLAPTLAPTGIPTDDVTINSEEDLDNVIVDLSEEADPLDPELTKLQEEANF